MPIELIALDLDGTALRSDNTLSPRIAEAVEAAAEKGIEIVAASGRPYGSMPKDFLKLSGVNYVISSNGAAVHDLSGNRIHETLMEEPEVLKLLRLTKDIDLIWEAFLDGETCTDKRYYDDPVKYGCHEAYVEYVQSSRGCSDDMRGYIFERKDKLDSVEIVCSNKALREEIRAKLEDNLDTVYITSSSADFIEFMDRDATKSNAVRFICERENIDINDTAACGNADNDVDMIAQAGVGAAVKNATKSCLEAADIVVDSNDKNGVKQLIEKLLELKVVGNDPCVAPELKIES